MDEMKPDQESDEAREGQTRKDELVLNNDSMDRFVEVFEASARRWGSLLFTLPCWLLSSWRRMGFS